MVAQPQHLQVSIQLSIKILHTGGVYIIYFFETAVFVIMWWKCDFLGGNKVDFSELSQHK